MTVITGSDNASCLNVRCLKLLVAALTLGVIGLVAFAVVNNIHIKKDAQQSSNENVSESNVDIVRKYYHKFFMDRNEAIIYARKLHSQSNVTKANRQVRFTEVCPESTTTPNFSPPENGKRRKRSLSYDDTESIPVDHVDRYHGCCISRRKLISPNQAIAEDDETKVFLFHYPGGRQYFLAEQYKQDASCNLECGCRAESNVFNAVVYSSSPGIRVRPIRVNGFSKCVNGASPPWTLDWIG